MEILGTCIVKIGLGLFVFGGVGQHKVKGRERDHTVHKTPPSLCKLGNFGTVLGTILDAVPQGSDGTIETRTAHVVLGRLGN